ncbi:MAG: methyltransferase domain-containing protein [Chitinophagaceae bacterium]|nr:methyltransferase domain-containing protein [Chitinophagaceae bacterium]
MLNIGCGHRFHKDWENIDIDPASPEVKKVNILKGLPYADNSFDIVYHSNILEHLPSDTGKKMIEECFRVLKPGGMIRINVPDMEKICREYLSTIDNAIAGDEMATYNHDWMLIEMLDQVSRNKSGGQMAEYLSQPEIINIEFLKKRLGDYVTTWRLNMNKAPVKKSISEKLRFILKHPDRLKRLWYYLVLSGKERAYLEIGRFRLGGEVHYQMYDRYSLERLLLNTGFKKIQIQTPVTSSWKNWTSYNLDSPDDGAALLAEAFK